MFLKWLSDSDASYIWAQRLICLLVLVFCTLTAFAQQTGLEIQVETGKCHYGESPDGMFYQGRYQTNNQLNPPCNNISLSGLFGQRIGWRVGYHDFGTIRARDNRFIRRDDEYASPPGTPCDPNTASGCYGSMYGEGHNWGLSVAATYRYPLTKSVDVIGEAGLFFFNSAFHAWAQRDEDSGLMYVDEGSSFRDSPPAPILGLGLRWKYLVLMARHYHSLGHRAQSLTDHNVNELTVGLAVPLRLFE